jgi:hypothetical protein
MSAIDVSRRSAPLPYVDIVFDGPPGHEAGRFVEAESPAGTSVRIGEWIDRGDGCWALRIPLAAAMEGAPSLFHQCRKCGFPNNENDPVFLRHTIDDADFSWCCYIEGYHARDAAERNAEKQTVAAPPSDRGGTDDSRCAVCGWPLAAKVAEGCVRGNCSQRPLPRPFYDNTRAIREYNGLLTPSAPSGEPTCEVCGGAMIREPIEQNGHVLWQCAVAPRTHIHKWLPAHPSTDTKSEEPR